MQYGMAIDLKKCIGCQACVTSCKLSNNLPIGVAWNTVHTEGGQTIDTASGTYPDNSLQHVPFACQHCRNPVCITVCPTSSTLKRETDGIVTQDYDSCIGCNICIEACPYEGARIYNADEPKYAIGFAVGDEDVLVHKPNVVEKCTMCQTIIDKGGIPKCVEACVGHARYFGDIDDPNSDVSKLIAARNSKQLLAEKGTDPSIFYLE